MSKHTKGPWAFTEGTDGGASMVTTEKDKSFQIAMVVCEAKQKSQRAEDIANARLIAAAPTMLDAMMNALLVLNRPERSEADINYCRDMLKIGIAKATGPTPA